MPCSCIELPFTYSNFRCLMLYDLVLKQICTELPTKRTLNFKISTDLMDAHFILAMSKRVSPVCNSNPLIRQ